MDNIIKFVQKKYLYLIFWIVMLLPIVSMIKGIIEPSKKLSFVKDSNNSLPAYLQDAINSLLIEYNTNHKTKIAVEIVTELPNSIKNIYGEPDLPYDRFPEGTLLIPLYKSFPRETKSQIKLFINPQGSIICIQAPEKMIKLIKSNDFPEKIPSVDGILSNDLTFLWQNITTPEQVIDSIKSFTQELSEVEKNIK